MKQILTYEQQLPIAQHKDPITVSLSKYTDCIIIFVNQTGAPGSILEGKMIESAGEADYDDIQEIGQQEAPPLYELRGLFGSSEIEFYELFLRRFKRKENLRVLLNISLPVISPAFKEEVYYSKLTEQVRKGLKTVFD